MDQFRRIAIPIAVGAALFILGAVGIVHWMSAAIPIPENVTPSPILAENRKAAKPEPAKKSAAKEVPDLKPPPLREKSNDANQKPAPKKDDDAERKKAVERGQEARRQEQQREADNTAAAKREAARRGEFRRMILSHPQVPTGKYTPYYASQKAAAQFETIFFNILPDFKDRIDHFDVSTADGSLVVNLPANAPSDKTPPKDLIDEVVRVWRESKFTRTYGFSKTVEFRARGGVVHSEDGGASGE